MDDRDAESNMKRMSLGEHLEELRRRIIYALAGLAAGTAACMYFTPELIAILKAPYISVMTAKGLKPDLTILEASGGITLFLKVSIYAGLVVSSPWVFYQVWMFVSAGLYPHERRYVQLAAPFSAVLFLAGAIFFLLVLSRTVLRFLICMILWMGATPLITFQSHISLMANLMVVFGLGFQMPLLVIFLGLTGLVSLKTLNRYRRHVIVGVFIIAALCTSPSPVDQVALAIPLWVLYELGVLLLYVISRRKKPAG